MYYDKKIFSKRDYYYRTEGVLSMWNANKWMSWKWQFSVTCHDAMSLSTSQSQMLENWKLRRKKEGKKKSRVEQKEKAVGQILIYHKCRWNPQLHVFSASAWQHQITHLHHCFMNDRRASIIRDDQCQKLEGVIKITWSLS